MPTISVKALGEFLEKPVVDQMRLLAEQKHPNAAAAAFKVHYYQSARAAIYQFFKHGNDRNRLKLATARIVESTMDEHKKKHNVRAIVAFERSSNFNVRKLVPTKSETISFTKHNTDIRLFPDLLASENGVGKYVLFNFSATAIEPLFARRCLELMYWTVESAGIDCSPADMELLDLANLNLYGNKGKPRVKTIRLAEQNLRAIDQLWPII